ncbi:hypothetical protein [Streptomyces sp. NPDC088727]|uniref:hypothetical protein n=1 Tax=Streptomyces sp. NPDC088727 TaxID=3365875 RepID=UPI003812BFA7
MTVTPAARLRAAEQLARTAADILTAAGYPAAPAADPGWFTAPQHDQVLIKARGFLPTGWTDAYAATLRTAGLDATPDGAGHIRISV